MMCSLFNHICPLLYSALSSPQLLSPCTRSPSKSFNHQSRIIPLQAHVLSTVCGAIKGEERNRKKSLSFKLKFAKRAGAQGNGFGTLVRMSICPPSFLSCTCAPTPSIRQYTQQSHIEPQTQTPLMAATVRQLSA